MKPKIYIAGPYTKGDTILNIREALLEANKLLNIGFIPFVPHITGFWHLLFPQSYATWMEYDAEWLKECDAVFRLDGESAGAELEVHMAEELGIPVFYDRSNLLYHFRNR
jgi:hypothetical protein